MILYLFSSVIWNHWICQVPAEPFSGHPHFTVVLFELQQCVIVREHGALQGTLTSSQTQLTLIPKRTETQKTEWKLHQEHPSPFPSLSGVSHCPDPLTTPSGSSDTAPGSSLANTDQSFWAYWTKNCWFLILSIAKEWHHLCSSLTSSLGFTSCICLLTVLILCRFPLNFGSSPASLSTPTHVFLWLVLSLFSILPNSHFEWIAVCFPFSYLFCITFHLIFPFISSLKQDGAVSQSCPPSQLHNYCFFGHLIPFT